MIWIARIGVAAAVGLFIWYVIGSYQYYSKYFDVRLNFIPPTLNYAYEDILGLGFLLSWIPLFILQLSLFLAGYYWLSKYKKVFLSIFTLFVIFSIFDFALYEKLKAHVINR